MEINDLTDPERLFINRRRANISQVEAAALWGVSLYIYRKWENGVGDIPAVGLDDLRVHEEYLIRRLREGVSVVDFADRIGCSRWWVIRCERGDDVSLARLTDYWEAV